MIKHKYLIFQVYVSPKLASLVLLIVPTIAIGAVMYGRFLKTITKKVQDSLADATQVQTYLPFLNSFDHKLRMDFMESFR